MTVIEAIVLGIVQGATEFIPISSSGHLVLVPWLLGWQEPGLLFIVAVHLGTLVAVLVYFWREWWNMIRAVLRWPRTRDSQDPDFKLFWLLLLGTIPAGALGLLFKDFFEKVFETPLVAALMLLITAALLVVSEWFGRLQRGLGELTWIDSLVVGFGQALAIMPGLSRSGATIAAGRMRHLTRDVAARFSFLLSMPIIAATGLLQAAELATGGMDGATLYLPTLGFLAALVSGYLVIRWLLSFLRTRSTLVFAIYCVSFAVFNLIVFFLRSGA